MNGEVEAERGGEERSSREGFASSPRMRIGLWSIVGSHPLLASFIALAGWTVVGGYAERDLLARRLHGTYSLELASCPPPVTAGMKAFSSHHLIATFISFRDESERKRTAKPPEPSDFAAAVSGGGGRVRGATT